MDEKGPLQMQQPLLFILQETDTRCASDKLLEHALVRSQSVGKDVDGLQIQERFVARLSLIHISEPTRP